MSVNKIHNETGASKASVLKYTNPNSASLPSLLSSKSYAGCKHKTTEEEDDAIHDATTKNPQILLEEINKNIIPENPVSESTLKQLFKEIDIHKWLAAFCPELEEKDAV
ncbi:hypothetical protein L873DRAFT_1794432 [Choiromyces venosus 120613-1]|uniref:Uncharacterized protein n=1 Tax=Choiromyces venosus 120613-1 TaxID=1336337 RepID=A0A3N4J1K4_9PEZI|nr:hypothetical protein L873DRAFT_1794432 [Choiromyces venosus 120613-1]